MIKDFYMFFGNLIDNYVVLIILFCILIKIVSIPLKVVLSKQQKEKVQRDDYCKELYSKYSDDQEKLSDEIYKYYKESKYNPLVYFSIKTVIIIVNILLILLMVGTFKPISNFTDISETEKNQIIDIYEEKNHGLNYQEISLLNNLDQMNESLLDAGISSQTIQTLYNLKDKFTLFDVPMYEIPHISGLNLGSVVLVIALATSFARIIPPIQHLIKYRKSFNRMGLQEKQKFIVSPVISLITFILSISIILNTPLVVCFYFIFQYLYALILELMKTIFNYKKSKETSGV